MLKWMKRVALVAAALLLLALLTGFVYEQWSRRSVAQAFPPPGTLVEVNGQRSHLYCTGEGSPTVILEAGINEGGSQTWERVRPDISRLSRVCAYDQSAIMWSDRRAQPRDAERIVGDLHDLLIAAGEAPPYVMVGHSLGGLMIRVFADHFSEEVVGLVFVDSSHPEQNQRFPADVLQLMAYPSTLLLKTISAFGVLRLESPPPPSALPQPIGEAIRSHLPQSMVGVADEIDAMDSIFAQAQHTGPFGDLPMVILTAGRMPEQLPWQLEPEMRTRIEREWSTIWPKLQAEIAALSTNSDRRTLANASHFIPYEAPDAVVTAVKDVLGAQREGRPVRHAEK
ncbi:alpha/beta fold hydrolase [Vacuolonema iberomarrocanum]|uniref:alpha/beta fold hydrolase n=1 Tax=Vacuolonema iberomarrocanum TaxID=3454632 RepID=UPI0019FC4733|nr:alpha/beta hydrolase [filamentous cyanobacterium LEGE 07170]